MAKYTGKKKEDAEIYFCLFPFFPFFISQSNVIQFVSKDFSRITVPRILKFDTNVQYDLYCVKENQPPPAYLSFICPFFFLSNQIFCQIFLGSYESQSL